MISACNKSEPIVPATDTERAMLELPRDVVDPLMRKYGTPGVESADTSIEEEVTAVLPANTQPTPPAVSAAEVVSTASINSPASTEQDARREEATRKAAENIETLATKQGAPIQSSQSSRITDQQRTNQPAVDPVVAAVSVVAYRQMTFPEPGQVSTIAPEQWIDYLSQIDQGLKALLLDEQGRTIARDEFYLQARRLTGFKLQAAEALGLSAETELQRELAILGKLEALSQFASLGDRLRATELLSYASENASFHSAQVARQASLILLAFALNDLGSGGGQPDSILEQVNTVLADRDALKMPEMKMMERIITVMREKKLDELANEIQSKTAAAFLDNSEASLAFTAWQMSVNRSPEFLDLQNVLKQTNPPASLTQRTVDNFLGKFPGQWSLLALSGELKDLEYAGELTTAAVLAEMIDKNAQQIVAPELQRQIQIAMESYKLHGQLVGRELNLDQLERVDGRSFQLSSLAGKVVLIDYWATWCKICRAEFPELRKLYSKNRDAGFEIVGVNVDENRSSMEAILKTTDLPWIQVASSNTAAVGMNSPAALQVGLLATPLTILLGRDGKAVAINLHGQELADAVAAELKK